MRCAKSSTSRLGRLLGAETGSASLEFLSAGLLFLLPLIYIALSFGQLQAAALAAEGAARHGARVWVQQTDLGRADALVGETVALAASDFRLDPAAVSWRRDCGRCLEAGSRVRITVEVRVPLPLVPAIWGLDQSTAITVRGSAQLSVSKFGGVPR